MNLRERHKARTREALADAAVRLFLERGFDATPVDDVALAAGVSRRTFFRYFPTKEAAFFAPQDARLEAFAADAEARVPRDGAWVAVREALFAVEPSFATDRARAFAWHRVLRSSPTLLAHDRKHDAVWEARIAGILERGGAERFEARVRAATIMGVVRAVLVAWYDGGARGDLDAMARRAWGWLEGGAPISDRTAR